MLCTFSSVDKSKRLLQQSRSHKNEQFEQERVTPVEACSPVKIIELY